jgi:hypothetical protein
MYVAIVNVPGYLPESDPAYFDTARDAWEYLREEIEQDETRNDPHAVSAIERQIDAQPPYELGSVVAYDNEQYTYDLGMAYTVDQGESEEGDDEY